MINKRKDFVPRSYASRIFFLRQFLRVFLTEAANYGFSQEEIDEITLLINRHIENYRSMISKREEAQAATAKALVSGKLAIDKVRKFSSRIKVAPNYHDSFGRLLGIIGEETVLDPDEMKPTLKVSLSGGVPVIKWKKHFTDGIDIFSRRGEETGFTFLARANISPYRDDRPNLEHNKPEYREYEAFYIKADKKIGTVSSTETILVNI